MAELGKQGRAKLSKSALCVKLILGSVLTLPLSFNALSDVIWEENFDAAALDGKGAVGGDSVTIDMDGVSRWSIDVSDADLSATSDWFKVDNGQLSARDVDGDTVWLSEVIVVNGLTDLQLDVEVSESGTQEDLDYVDVMYSIDGGEFVLVTNALGSDIHTLIDDYTSVTVNSAIPDASTVQIKLAMKNNAGTESHLVNSVVLSGSTGEDGGGDEGGDDGEVSEDTLRTLTETCFNCPDLTAVKLPSEYVEADYYAQLDTAITNNESAETLKALAQNIISLDHHQLSYSEAWTALTDTDQDPANPDNVVLFYMGTSLAKFSNGSGTQSSNQDNWNREHVWANSHGFSSNSLAAYTDIHHLRPTDISVNGSRGNLDFDFSDGALSEAPENSIDSDLSLIHI